jgi:formate dehydrogenase beta subunit
MPASTSARWTASPSRATARNPICDRLKAPAANLTQDIYVADGLKTGRIMAKDEDVCLHCGLCAERCPTGAWDMKKYLIEMTYAGTTCQHEAQSAA